MMDYILGLALIICVCAVTAVVVVGCYWVIRKMIDSLPD